MAFATRQVSFQERNGGLPNVRVVSFNEKNGGDLSTARQLSFHERSNARELFLNSRQFSLHERHNNRNLSNAARRKSARELSMKRGDTPLHSACRAGDLLQVKEIIHDSGSVGVTGLMSKENQGGEIPLYVAAENGHTRVVAEILKFCDVETAAIMARNGYDAFHIAAKQGHVDVLKELLASFPELAMTTDPSNSTALHSAANQGHIDVLNLLLEIDASLAKIAKSNGKTALHSSARMGHVAIVRALLTKEPSFCHRTDKKGQTALHMAVKGQVVEVVQELITSDPTVINLLDNKRNTALHIATNKGRLQIVRALLAAKGINVNAANKAGDTALDIAEKCSHADIAAMLKERGAMSSKESAKPPTPARQLRQTVSDIKHEVHSQIQQTHRTTVRVQKISKRLQKMHAEGLTNAINSATVAVLIATVAFAAIFTVPGQFVQYPDASKHQSLGQAYVAGQAAFIVFLIFDSLALFISLAVVVAQTSIVVIEQKAKQQLMFVINKLMWLTCLLISVSFIALTYVVVGRRSWWLAESVTAIGGSIMLLTIGSMAYCIIRHRMDKANMRNIQRSFDSQSCSWSKSFLSDTEMLENDYKKMYLL